MLYNPLCLGDQFSGLFPQYAITLGSFFEAAIDKILI